MKVYLMKVYHVVSFYFWYLLQFYNCTCLLVLPKIKKNHVPLMEEEEVHVSLPEDDEHNYNHPYDEMMFETEGKENFPLDNPFTDRIYHFGFPAEILKNGTNSLQSVEEKGSNKKDDKANMDLNLKLVKILSAAGFFKNNNHNMNNLTLMNQNLLVEMSTNLPLGQKKSANLTRQYCCSKDQPEKCKGVDLSYLLPIPGDNTTTVGSTTVKNGSFKGSTKGICVNHCIPSVTEQTNFKMKTNKHGFFRSGRGYRKVEDSTLDALKRLQLTHGIFAPNEEDVEKAVEKAKIQIAKVKNRFPDWLKHKNYVGAAMPKILHENVQNKNINKVINKDYGDLYKILPKIKIEQIVNEGNMLKPILTSGQTPSDFSLLYQNAAAIKKQLETIRQYDILLANIRAQAQLKLIELADAEARHRIEEVRFKKEHVYGLEDLKNMEEVLRQEIKLAKNLPGAASIWPAIQENVDMKMVNTNFSDLDFLNENMNSIVDKQKNPEIVPEAVNRNNQLLEELDTLLHETENYVPQYKDINFLPKSEHRTFLDENALDKYTLLEKTLGRSLRNLDNSSVPIVKRNRRHQFLRVKRKSDINKQEEEDNLMEMNNYEKVFHNLQSDLLQLKNQLLTHGKSKMDEKDKNNVLVQIKVSVDVANTTEHTFNREITSNCTQQ